MPFLINSSPGAGLRYEAAATVGTAKEALDWAAGLHKRGMRLIRIRDMTTGLVFDEKSFRAELAQSQAGE